MLIIGAGPSGLSAAYHLARLGHEVEIRDAGSEPGGIMRYGIHQVVHLDAERREGGLDAVFVAVGAHLSERVGLTGLRAANIRAYSPR